jgi:hypothetical protein
VKLPGWLARLKQLLDSHSDETYTTELEVTFHVYRGVLFICALVLEVAGLAEFVDRTVADIDGRLEDLEAEMTKLQSARSVLAGRRPGRPARIASVDGAEAARHGSRSRGRRGGTRGDQALANIRESRFLRSRRRWEPSPITCIG